MREKKQGRNLRRLLSLLLAVLLIVGMLPAESIFALETESAMETEENAETESAGAAEQVTEAGEDTGLEPADPKQSAATETPASETEPEPSGESEEAGETTYTNSINGTLWYDLDADGIYSSEEQPIASYPVSLYKSDDTDSAVQTTITNANGGYEFSDIEPGSYVVGVKSNELDSDYYLLPWVDIVGDNKFGTWSEDYKEKYSELIKMDEDTIIEGIDGGMRTPPGVQPMVAWGPVTAAPGATITGVVQGYNISWVLNSFTMTATTLTMDATNWWSVGSMVSSYVVRIGTSISGEDVSGTLQYVSHSGDWANPSGVNSVTTFTGLSPNTTYYVDTYTSSSRHVGYFVFTTPPSPPTATTNAATNVTGTSATLNGIFNTSGASGTVRFDYGTTSNLSSFTSVNSTTNTVSANTAKAFSLTGLTPGTTYYYRIYVTTAGGATGGGIQSFTTPPAPTATTNAATSITGTSATLNGIFNTSGVSGTVRFDYNTTNNFSTYTSVNSTTNTVSANTAKAFSLTGLTPGTTYYYRIYVTTAGGATGGGVQSFTTSLPTATTGAASSITSTGATITGSFNTFGGTVSMGQIWYSSTDSTLSTAPATVKGWYGAGDYTLSGNNGTVSTTLSGLTPNTTYNYRMAMTVSGKTVYGNVLSFKTLPSKPTATATAATNVTMTSATLNGNFNTMGVENGNGLNHVQIWYSTDQTTGTDGELINGVNVWGGIAQGTYSPTSLATTGNTGIPATAWANPTGLTPNTTYYYQLSINTTGGTVYSNVISFTTLTSAPTATATAATNVTTTSATMNGTFNTMGVDKTTGWLSGHIWWGTDPTIGSDGELINYTSYGFRGSGAYSPTNLGTPESTTGVIAAGWYNATGLAPNTTYYYQVFIDTTGGKVNSNVVSFTTLPDFTSWSAVPNASDYTEAVISGSYYTGETITGATITYGKEPTLSDGTETLLTLTGSEYSDAGFSYTLTGLDLNDTYYVKTTVTNASGTTTSTIKSFRTGVAVTYDANGGTGSAYTDAGYGSGSTVTVKSDSDVSFLAPQYYEFVEWNTQADGGGTSYDPGDTFTITGHTTLYAQWRLVVQDLTIGKTVTGAYGDPNKAFEITITLEDGSSTPVAGSYTYTGSSSGSITFDSSGQGTITLKHGETITVKNIPQGYTYTVQETDAAVTGGLYTATYSGTGTVSGSGESISETLGSTAATVSITNDRSTVPVTGLGGTNDQLGTVGILAILAVAVIMLWSYRRRRKCR